MKLNLMTTLGLLTILAVMTLPLRTQAEDPKTELQYLSGHGPKDAVPWDFKISGGRRSGESATIPVPSNWELQGFGSFTYGQEVEVAKTSSSPESELAENAGDYWQQIAVEEIAALALRKLDARAGAAVAS